MLCMGNPLLDISAVCDQAFLDKYGIKMNNAILCEDDKTREIYADMIGKYEVEYIAGGATQNSARVAQWMLQEKGAVTYMGCVGKDEYATKMTEVATADGMNVRYMVDEATPTGTCAVCVLDAERSLVANLSAANNYKLSHCEENWSVVEAAKFYYMAGFFITVSPDTILKVAKHSCEQSKTFMMNLSAPFIMQVPPFKAALMEAMPYIDILFGNETEAQTFAETEGWETRDVAEIALKIAAMPKESGGKPRIVVFTQGADATVVAKDGAVTKYDVIKLEKSELVDTNGAGDAFVGGFLAALVKGKEIADCCKAGNYGANTIIKRSGCSYPPKPEYTF